MRPLVHPALKDVTVEGVLHALSDPVRAAIFAEILDAPCPQTCSSYCQVGARAVPKSTLSQHIRLLREAGLIRCERQGVEMRITSRHAELSERFPGLLEAIVRAQRIEACERAGRRPVRRRAAARVT